MTVCGIPAGRLLVFAAGGEPVVTAGGWAGAPDAARWRQHRPAVHLVEPGILAAGADRAGKSRLEIRADGIAARDDNGEFIPSAGGSAARHRTRRILSDAEARATVPKRCEGRRNTAPRGALSLTGGLCRRCELPGLFANTGVPHREQARQLDVLDGTGGYSNTGDGWRHGGVGDIKITITPGPLAVRPVHGDEFSPAAESSCSTAALRLVLGFSLIAFRACGV